MIKNYLKIAIRNLLKNKTFSLINVLGMTIGMTSFMLIGVYVWEEIQYDQYYKDKDRTYRIYDELMHDNGQVSYLPAIPPVIGPNLDNNYPEVESTLRIMDLKQDVLITIDGESAYYSGAVYAENTVFDMLDVELVSGNTESALEKPNTVIVSESLATTLFGDEVALGQIINLSQQEFEISGVYKDFPKFSHLSPPMILSFPSFTQYMSESRMNNWIWHQFYTYVKFNQVIDEKQFESKLAELIADNAPPMEEFGLVYKSHLQNIGDVYLTSTKLEQDMAKRGSSTTLYALSASAIFIIVIVCLNFINLSTTQAMSRMKEVGVRKIIGANRSHVIFQFIGESIILSLLSVVLAGLIVEMSLTPLSNILERQLSFEMLSSPDKVLMALSFAIVLGIVAGLYPAFYASKFKSLSILRVKGGTTKGDSTFRSTMVVIQFALSASLIIVSIIVYQQVQFLRKSDLGFNKDHIITIPLKSGLRKNFETTKQLFLANPNIKSASCAYGMPGDIVAGDNIIQPIGNKTISTNLFLIDFDYLSTMGLDLVAGRDFDQELYTDATSSYIINEKAISALGYSSAEEAIGKPLHWKMWHYGDSLKKGEIIGVVKDFHFQSMREEISPSVLHIYPESYYKMALKVSGENLSETISFIEDTWAELEPTWPITYSFIDQDFDKMYQDEKRLGTMITVFTCIGIFIACLGLFGLVSFSTRMRLKEIGVRKVLGASVAQVVTLLAKNYILLLFLASILAVPLSVYVMNDWLSGFAYHIEVSPVVIVLSIISLIIIALVTVSFQSIKAALTNPVNVLKDE